MLELRAITKRFGDVLANDHIDIKVEPGTIHAIVGENGAGKSTAMRIAYGFYTADSGEIVVDGEPRAINTPHAAIALGIGMVHQHFMLVEPMTVAENIVLGAEPGSAAALDMREAAEKIRRLSGVVNFRGRDILRLTARARRELGIAHVPEDRHRRGLLLDFDLEENAILGVHYRRPAVSVSPLLDLRGIRE